MQRKNAVFAAASTGHVDNVKFLIRRGANVNAICTDEDQFRTALVAAVARSTRDFVVGEKKVLLLLEAGADSNVLCADASYGSALAAAAICANLTIMKLLLDKGADANARLKGSYGSALVAAAASGNDAEAKVRLLLGAGADLNAPVPDGRYGSVLAAAAYVGSLSVMQLLLDKGVDVNARLQGPYVSALVAAAKSPHNTASVRFLLKAGADINARADGQPLGTALTAAVHWGYTTHKGKQTINETVKFLLDEGADINARFGGPHGSALAAALDCSNISLTQLLLDHGADPTVKNEKSRSVFHFAAKSGNPGILKLILDHWQTTRISAKPTRDTVTSSTSEPAHTTSDNHLSFGDCAAHIAAADAEGRTPLHLAAQTGTFASVQRLMDYGLLPSDLDKYGRSPLYCAFQGPNVESVVELLLEAHSRVASISTTWTLVHWACRYYDLEMVQRLLRHGVVPSVVQTAEPNKTWSPISIAIYFQNKHFRTRKRLERLQRLLESYESAGAAHLTSDLDIDKFVQGCWHGWTKCIGCGTVGSLSQHPISTLTAHVVQYRSLVHLFRLC